MPVHMSSSWSPHTCSSAVSCQTHMLVNLIFCSQLQALMLAQLMLREVCRLRAWFPLPGQYPSQRPTLRTSYGSRLFSSETMGMCGEMRCTGQGSSGGVASRHSVHVQQVPSGTSGFRAAHLLTPDQPQAARLTVNSSQITRLASLSARVSGELSDLSSTCKQC